ncbi:MAG: LPS export ABC transporter permease LptG [Gammaproteobacteria bacterium]|nr:LPS export ABC transporter permease LptG [Gammaproteobacteria bacterium]
MKIIQRYIAKNVMISTLLVFLVVCVLSFVINLLGELRDIGVGDYGFLQAVLHVLFLLPHTVYQLFPMLILLGGILGLGALASSHELIVMRASGLSVKSIAMAVFIAALCLIFLASLVGELVAPRANFLADQRKSNAETNGQAVVTTSGVWIHEGNNFLHIEQVLGRDRLEGVTRYEFDSRHQLLASYYAKSANFVNHQWILHDLVKTEIEKDKTVSREFSIATWHLTLTPNYLTVGLVEPEAMTLRKLAEYSLYLRHNNLQASSFQIEFWKRIFQPLTTLVMILLAIPFVFTAPRSMSQGKRILLAIFIGFGFYIVNAFVGEFSIVFQFPPLVAGVIPILVFAGIGGGLMWRVKG